MYKSFKDGIFLEQLDGNTEQLNNGKFVSGDYLEAKRICPVTVDNMEELIDSGSLEFELINSQVQDFLTMQYAMEKEESYVDLFNSKDMIQSLKTVYKDDTRRVFESCVVTHKLNDYFLREAF